MHGNLWQWCSDFDSKGHDATAEKDPQGPKAGKNHVARGGSWCSDSVFCRSAQRGGPRPDYSSGSVGLRIATGVE